jgi:RNA polymerase sigma-70 factor (ECF subfamily)
MRADMKIEEEYDKIFRYCYYRLPDRQTAEDMTQEVFLHFLNSGYQEQGKEIRYLYTIARNLCIDESRKRKWQEIPSEYERSDEGVSSDELLEKLHIKKALMQLPEDDRELLVLRYVNEEPVSLICKELHISRFALYRRLTRIKRNLKDLLEG